MKKLLPGLAAGLCLLGTLDAETVLSEDFKAPRKISEFESSGNGALKLNAQDAKKVCGYKLADALSLDSFAFSFKVRMTKPNASDRHFGVKFVDSIGKTMMLFTRGDSVTLLRDGETTVGPISQAMKGSPDSPWTDFRIEFDSNNAEVNVDRKLAGSFSFEFAKLKSIELYSCLANVEFAACKLEAFSKKAAQAEAAGSLSLEASFDGDLSARSSSGQLLKPLKAAGVSFVDGIRGKAAHVDGSQVKDESGKSVAPQLIYSVEDVFKGPAGSISFWFRPGWDGADNKNWRFLLTGDDAKDKGVMSLWLWEWVRTDIPRKDMAQVSVNRNMRGYFFKGDWMHFALVWDADGWVKLFVDGIPYRQGNSWMKEHPERFKNIDMASVKKLCVGCGIGLSTAQNASGDFADLKLYSRALQDDEIVSEYRKAMPVDLLMERAVVFSDRDETLELLLAPGGLYARPSVGSLAPNKAKVSIRAELVESELERPVASKEFQADVQGEMKLSIPVGRLPQGVYRLKCQVKSDGACVQKSFTVVSWKQAAASEPSAAGLSLGAPLFSFDFAKEGAPGVVSEGGTSLANSPFGSYLEAGRANGSRFGVVVPFPQDLMGKPVIVEVEWPDDKPRSMGLYMYPKSATDQHRERMEGGVQGGNEYPLTNKPQIARYLFYPGVESYLFEARTMVGGMPAAVSKLNVYPILDSRLPKLAVEYPAGVPHRLLGHMDEDQTADVMLNQDDQRQTSSPFRTEMVMEKWCDYFDYTGQGAVSYPALRYSWPFYALDGYYGNGLLPYKAGEFPAFIEMLGHRSMQTIAIVNLYTLPEFVLAPERMPEYTKKGFFVVSSDGSMGKSGHLNSPKPEFLNREVRDMFIAHIKAVASRYGSLPGFDGIEIWSGILTLALKEGYGDLAVELFSKETGVAVPEDKADKFGSRFKFLCSPDIKARWLAWRASKTTELVSEIARAVQASNPKLKLYLNVSGRPTAGSTEDESSEGLDVKAWHYENSAVDFDAIASIPGVYATPTRHSTSYRWEMHWGHPESTVDEALFDFSKFAPYVNKDGVAFSNSYPAYFETFRKSMVQDVYKAYFQNADVKPHGRYFLKELVYSLALMDAQRILIGAQPLGTWGRDEETREFAKAYCALPALPFRDVEGMRDPVCARFLNSSSGSYLYAANLLWSDCKASLALSPGSQIKDLSTGEILKASSDGLLSFDLKPYQLRSFVSSDAALSPAKGGVSVPDAVSAFYKERIDVLSSALNKVSSETLEDTSKYRSRIVKVQALLRAGEYGEAHRLLFSKMMNSLLKLQKVANDGFLKEQSAMMASSRYAVKCGSEEYCFYRASDGTLFFPDQGFKAGNYGYDGSYKNVVRDVSKMKSVPDPEIYKSESYDLDAYRFKVKPGKYSVRFYFKVGYEPNAKIGKNVVNIDIEGKRVLDKFDIFKEAGCDFNVPIVKQVDGVQVSDGVLDIEFSVPEGVDSSVRFANAIEVIPMGK